MTGRTHCDYPDQQCGQEATELKKFDKHLASLTLHTLLGLRFHGDTELLNDWSKGLVNIGKVWP